MKKNWYVVAHRSGARIFEQAGVSPTLSLVTSIENPEGRMKESELVSDRPGRSPQTLGTGFNEYSPEQSHKDRVAESFAKQLAQELSVRNRDAKFDYLVLVAEPQVLGKLRDQLDKGVSQKVRATLPKDLAYVSEKDIGQHLDSVLFTREPVA